MKHLRLLCTLGLVSLAVARVDALEWPQPTMEAQTAPFQKTLSLVFVFKNAGALPVHLLDLQTSCSCITARTDKKTYAPGESGQLTAQFTAEDPPGIYERHISVLTDESAPPQRLTVRIEIPELVTLTPRSVAWKLGESLTEKSIELRTNGDLRLCCTGATPSNATFSARLETVVPDQVYRLVVLPQGTAAVANAAIRISGHDHDGHEILVSAYANVR
jgi:hypothetical protein